ncbi:MAG: hypothetical protein JO087_11880 [Actinobacteria bacterium]|nr:hypothetical protein [Actinomycetota bacterium]
MRRPRWGVPASVAVLLLAGCVSHPVGPARTHGKYSGKASTTAESALSAVETARLSAQTGSRDHAFGPYLSVILGESEDAVTGVQGTFDSIQPPDEKADQLKQKLDDLLSTAADHLTNLRVAVRRGEIKGLEQLAAPLAGDAKDLQRFMDGLQ